MDLYYGMTTISFQKIYSAVQNYKDITHLSEVIEVMKNITDVLPPTHGVAAFNEVYLGVTTEVREWYKEKRWESPVTLECIDVEFAKLYFGALSLWVTDRAHTPPAWVPLFKRAEDERFRWVQFVLAGMNAHINRDLPLALLRSTRKLGKRLKCRSYEHHDFIRVNQVLWNQALIIMQGKAREEGKQMRRFLRLVHPQCDIWILLQLVAAARQVAFLNALSIQRFARPSVHTLDRRAKWLGDRVFRDRSPREEHKE